MNLTTAESRTPTNARVERHGAIALRSSDEIASV